VTVGQLWVSTPTDFQLVKSAANTLKLQFIRCRSAHTCHGDKGEIKGLGDGQWDWDWNWENTAQQELAH